jgi:hypothetical protein
VHSLKQVSIHRLIVLLRWYVFEPKNPNFECHLKYLVYALCKSRYKIVFYTSVTHRGWTQVKHLKVSSKFEFEFVSRVWFKLFNSKLNSNEEIIKNQFYNWILFHPRVALSSTYVVWLNDIFGWWLWSLINHQSM